MPKGKSQVWLGILCAIIAAVGFSIKSILIKLAFAQGVDSVTLLALRMLFAMPFFIAMLVWDKSKTQRINLQSADWRMILALSTAYYLFNVLDFLGLQTVSAGLERLIQFLYPTMTVLLAAWLYRRRLGRAVIWAMLLSYAGITLVFWDQALHDVSSQHAGFILGSVLIFISALCYAIYLVGAGHVIPRMGATRFTAYAMLLASMASLVQFLLTHHAAQLLQNSTVYGLAVAMALFSTVMPVFALAAGMRLIGSANTSLIGSAGPVFTIYLAHVFLGEKLSAVQLIGSLLVLLGVLLISKHSKKESSAAVTS
jgi:drug/metabolite transporter (DMT)-like permease